MGMLVKCSEEAATQGLSVQLGHGGVPPSDRLPVMFKYAVIVAKKTRWDYERERHPFLGEEELKEHLRNRGTDVEEILMKHRRQQEVISDHIEKKLRAHNIGYTMLSMKNYPGIIEKADLVISAGGDGTFLTAAAAVKDSTKPVVGINTDPVGSEGHLCVGGKNPPMDLVERVVSGRFRWLFRNRIRVTILNGKHRTVDKILALNEVFIGEKEAGKVSYYEVSIDDQPMVRQKSSGMVVCTGTGSPAWNYSINRVEEENISSILEVMRNLGLSVPSDISSTARLVAENVNRKLIFDPDHPNMSFTIREPIFNQTFPRTATRGFASRLRLKSRCSDAYLALDGTRKIPFNHGTEVLLEICPEDALRTLHLH